MVAIVTFSWSAPLSPLPPGASPVASYNLRITDVNNTTIWSKNGLPATATSYTTTGGTGGDNLTLLAGGMPYTFWITAVDATNKVSLTPGAIQFEAMLPALTPPVPQGVTAGPVTFQ